MGVQDVAPDEFDCRLKWISNLEMMALVQEKIEGQLNATERQLLTAAVRSGSRRPKTALEVGTWLGGGSTAHILDALESNGAGHLWGIEADRAIYEQMIRNLEKAVPLALHRFTPLFGFSQKVIPQWLAQQSAGFEIDFAFLDGGNNPLEQIVEFRLIDPHMPVGAVLMAHDAKLRKGKWLVPYLAGLDHWSSEVHDVSGEGLLRAQKVAAQPSEQSLRRARLALLKMRCAPIEVAAAITPRSFCRFIFNVFPRRFSAVLVDGRR
jgi:predicted O-methyltransferase YrrM